MSTVWEVVLAIELLAAVAALGWAGYVLFIQHDHADGPCGWAGCQAPATRRTR